MLRHLAVHNTFQMEAVVGLSLHTVACFKSNLLRITKPFYFLTWNTIWLGDVSSVRTATTQITGMGPFKCYVTQMGVGGVTFSGKKRYEGVRFNVISVTRGLVGVQFPGKSVT